MRKFFRDFVSKFQINDNDMVNFNNDIVIQVDSDDNKMTSKKSNKYKIFFFVYVKAKIHVICNLFCDCFSLKNENIEEDDIERKVVEMNSYSPEKSTSRVLEQQTMDTKNINEKGKKTLILDLDETLVHSFFIPTKCDLYLEIPYQDKKLSFFINIRPGVDLFIDIMSEYYEVVVYTASMSEYADKVIEYLDKNKKVSHRLFRENCTFHQRGFVKDLSKINRNLKDIIIIDNSPFSFCFQPDNGIPIKPFFDDPNDKELYNMIPFLIFLSKLNDVRSISAWKEKYYGLLTSFSYMDMENHMQVYDKLKDRAQESIEKKFNHKKLHLQLNLNTKKKKFYNNKNSDADQLIIHSTEEENDSAQKMKKKDFVPFEESNHSNTYDECLEEKTTSDFDDKIKEKNEFDDQRYQLDSSNINSPIIKKEIHFNKEENYEI